MDKRTDEDIYVLFHLNIGEDLKKLRAMLNEAEEICDMVTVNKELANRKFDKVLDLAREVIDASSRPAKNKKPPDR